MKNLKGVLSMIGIIVKYSAVVMAIIKGIETVYSELQKIDLDADSLTKNAKDV